MPNHGTPSTVFPKWYVKFQVAVLNNLPRPNGEEGDITEDIALGWADNGESLARVLRRELVPPRNEEPTPVVSAKPLLDLVGTVIFPGTTTPFIAKKHLVVNTAEDASVKIYFIGDNLKKWFFGKTEEAMPGGTLRCQKLRRSANDLEIIADLGGREKAETSLTEFFFLLGKQGNGEKGLLRTDGYATIFEIPDVDGVLRSVYAFFIAGLGWLLDASPVGRPFGWRDGRQVVSRNS